MKNKFLKIKLIKSLINLNQKHKLILKFFNLHKLNSIKIIKNNNFNIFSINNKFFLKLI